MSKEYIAEQALLPSGWRNNVAITVDAGIISGLELVEDNKSTKFLNAERLQGALLAGMPNLHSHAFQRALAGFTEHTTGHKDTFWTWRKTMYKFAMSFNPEMLKAVATQLYAEMLQAGYTSVAEFHYVHQPDPIGMSQVLIEAALATGIRLTLLPVLYQQSDFHHAPPNKGQQHFALNTETYLELIQTLQDATKDYAQIQIAIAPHSVRAVSRESLTDLFNAHPNTLRHIHAAEQEKEVHDTLNAYKARPVEWLLDNFAVNKNWCLIHATHMTKSEVTGLAASGAVAGLCPVTEANLGDGYFELRDYLASNGQLGIGSDSNNSISVIEELRTLEYGQRLKLKERNIMAGKRGSTGEQLYSKALAGGAQALGQKIGKLELGYAADLILLDTNHPQLVGHKTDTLLDAHIFSGNLNPIKEVMVAGNWIEASSSHHTAFANTMKVLSDL